MSFWISFLNDFAVSIFGSVLSASFCDALATRRNRRIFVCCAAYLAFLLYHSAREQTQIRLREAQKSLDIQLTQAVRGTIPAIIMVSDEPGHGIGVQSICAIVQRHGGVCSFQVQNGQFILRLSL